MERIHGLMDKNRIQGAADQGEQAPNCEALVAKETWRRSGSRVETDNVLTRGDLASDLKGSRRSRLRSETSAEAIVGRVVGRVPWAPRCRKAGKHANRAGNDD